MSNNGFVLDFGSDDNARWQQLLNEIDNGNVVPVIGPDMLVAPKISAADGRPENLHQQLISYIAAQTGVKTHPRTFSQLVYDDNYRHIVRNKTDQIYYLIHQILTNLRQIEDIDSQPSPLLMDLLGTRKFPFVITTSFSPIVEEVMKNVWGNVNVLNFNNNPQDSIPERGGDIRTANDLKEPTVYYMFGKYCNSKDRFVVTDSDMMTFCCSWIKGYGVPRNLTESLKKKYLLILGNNYSDWLFRFVWYGLRTTTNDMKSDVVVNEGVEESLKQFMERLETFYQENPAEVIKRIKKDVEERSMKKTFKTVYETDVFISYSRSDTPVAKNLYEALTAKGLKVWFDADSIKKAEDWEAAISNGIRNTRLFVPILSKNIEQESLIPHEYRMEWNLAANLSSKMGGRTFIIPFSENGFDFYNPLTRLPAEFTNKNATWFTEASDVGEITEVVLRELESLKEMESRLNL
jgi:hypothetical protein